MLSIKSGLSNAKDALVVDDFYQLSKLQPRSIVIFGGTFDPPHLGHFEAAMRLAQEADLVVIVPAAQNPLKAECPRVTDEDRLAMLQLMFARQEKVVICKRELLQQPGKHCPVYSITNVRQARTDLPNCQIKVAIGSDHLGKLHRWNSWQELLKTADILTICRQGIAPLNWDEVGRNLGSEAADTLKARLIPALIREASSSSIRAALMANDPKACNDLCEPVANYIRENGLYAGEVADLSGLSF